MLFHFGLPCGTCSQARERPLPSYLQHIKAPQPLRDEQHLEGLPSLTGSDLMKVQAANALYQAAVILLEICMQLKCCITIENPLRSWLWMLLAHYIKQSGKQALIDWYSNLECVTFDACAHGSDRDKRTKLLATPGVFSDLEQYCPKNHQHASWAPYKVHNRLVFPTATEAEYPSLLCSRMSACVQQFAASHGINLMLEPKLKDLMKLQLGQQSIRPPPLIAEFKTFVFLEKPSTDSSMKLLAAPINQGPQQPEQQEEPEQGSSSLKRKHDDAPSSSKRNTFKYGVWRSPMEFLDKVLQAKHPVDADSFLHEATKAAIEKVLVTDPITLAKQRLAVVFNLRKLQSEMSSKELESRRGMHQDVDKCTKSKSIALFAYVLKQLEYWDLGVVDLLREGIPLVGLQEAPKGYVKNLVPASITEDELMASAFWRRRALMCDHRDWASEEQTALLETTAEEVKMGFSEGPYNEEEMSVLLETDQWSLNPRFVLFQGSSGKVRIIDDAKKSCVNEALSSTVKLQLQDVDYVASMITLMAKEAASRGISLDLKGKTFDLSKAYKQLAVRPDHHKHAIVGFPIDGDWKFYRSISLPFGCTGSV